MSGPLPWLTADDDGDGLGSYEWLQRGLWLLDSGNAAAAATVLERVVVEEPRSASVLEALARAQFTAGRPGAAARTFETLAEVAPDSDYARFGWGQSLRRIGRLPQAAEQLALAVALNPDRREYATALARVRSMLDPSAPTAGGAEGTDEPEQAPAPDDDPSGRPDDGAPTGRHDVQEEDRG